MRHLTLTATQLDQAVEAWAIGGSLGLGLMRAKLKCDYLELLHLVCREQKRRGNPTGIEEYDSPPAPRKGEYLIPPGATNGTCRSCNAPVIWMSTANGRPMPLSAATTQEREGQRYALSHFADCPHAKGWSKK